MKKIAALLAIVTMLVSSRMIYPQACEVVDITDDLVTVSMSTGIEFQFYGAEDYEVGEIIALVFFTNGTRIVYDDVIVAHRATGFTTDNYVKGE